MSGETIMKMKRSKGTKKNKKYADAILVSDLHLTDRTPVSRVDDYLAAQIKKLNFLQSLQKENDNCPVLCAGDVFSYWKASPWLCSIAFENLPSNFVTIPGNHDLPMHSVGNYKKSALSLIDFVMDDFCVLGGENKNSHTINNNMTVIGIAYGEFEGYKDSEFRFLDGVDGRKILMLHELIWPGNRPAWDKTGYSDLELLKKLHKHFDLILTGHNHTGFVKEYKNTVLVNPGSMLRITTDQIDYQPCCYLYFAKDNKVEPINFPIKAGVHNTDHIDRKKERENRAVAYIERINRDKENIETDLSFRGNLEAFFKENKTPKKVRELIWENMEAEI